MLKKFFNRKKELILRLIICLVVLVAFMIMVYIYFSLYTMVTLILMQIIFILFLFLMKFFKEDAQEDLRKKIKGLKIMLLIIINIFRSLRHPYKTTYISRSTGKILLKGE